MADSGKTTAQSFSAGLATEKGMSPVQWGDKCFLCSQEIGETDPRQFYQGRTGMMLCHSGCLHIMHAHGGKPLDYHRAMTAPVPALVPGVRYAEPTTAAIDTPSSGGPSWMLFADLAALQEFTRKNGDIPSHVKVTVNGVIVQDAPTPDEKPRSQN